MTVTFYGVPGTWALPDGGFQADVARTLVDEFDDVYAEIMGHAGPPIHWQGVGYPAAFGPINPPWWAPVPVPSYADSVLVGVEENVRMINLNPNKFILSGYSQGAEVVGRVRKELVAGRLKHRAADCLLSITFGDPTRQASDEAYGGGDGGGISRFVIPQCPFRCVTYAAPGDMYCTTPTSGEAGADMHAMYMALTSFGGNLIITDMLAQIVKMLGNPFLETAGAAEAMIRAMKVGAHGTYGPWVGHAAGIVNEMVAAA